MAFSLTPKQAEARDLLSSTKRHCLLFGGSRSGKTFVLLYAVIVRALSAPGSRHLVARLHNKDVKQSVMMDTLPAVMARAWPGLRYREHKGDQYIVLPNGAEIWFGGLDDEKRVEKILGKEYATIWVNEASQVPYASVLTLRTRLAQKVERVDGRQLPLKAYYDLNPSGKGHWTYSEFVLGLRPENKQPVEEGSRGYLVMNPDDNPHLPAEYLAELDGLPERQRRRFRMGAYLEEVAGALWKAEVIDAHRTDTPPDLTRIVVAVDPSGSDGMGGDRQGIIVAGLGVDANAYVLEDASCRLAPEGWASRVKGRYDHWEADCVVAEINFGGAMVTSTLRTADRNLPVKVVTASRGKHVRAEPVSALYEQGKVWHVGRMTDLEEQLTLTTTTGYQGSGSPDRMDALVWALTELMLGTKKGEWALEQARRAAQQKADTPEAEKQEPDYAAGSLEWAAQQTAEPQEMAEATN